MRGTLPGLLMILFGASAAPAQSSDRASLIRTTDALLAAIATRDPKKAVLAGK